MALCFQPIASVAASIAPCAMCPEIPHLDRSPEFCTGAHCSADCFFVIKPRSITAMADRSGKME